MVDTGFKKRHDNGQAFPTDDKPGISSSAINEDSKEDINSDPNKARLNGFLKEHENAGKKEQEALEAKQIEDLEKQVKLLETLDDLVDDISNKKVDARTGLKRLLDFKDLAGKELEGDDKKTLDLLIGETRQIVEAEEKEKAIAKGHEDSDKIKEEQDKLQDDIENKFKHIDQKAKIIDHELEIIEKTETEQEKLQKGIEEKLTQKNKQTDERPNKKQSRSETPEPKPTSRPTSTSSPDSKRKIFILTNIQGRSGNI